MTKSQLINVVFENVCRTNVALKTQSRKDQSYFTAGCRLVYSYTEKAKRIWWFVKCINIMVEYHHKLISLTKLFTNTCNSNSIECVVDLMKTLSSWLWLTITTPLFFKRSTYVLHQTHRLHTKRNLDKNLLSPSSFFLAFASEKKSKNWF